MQVVEDMFETPPGEVRVQQRHRRGGNLREGDQDRVWLSAGIGDGYCYGDGGGRTLEVDVDSGESSLLRDEEEEEEQPEGGEEAEGGARVGSVSSVVMMLTSCAVVLGWTSVVC